MKALILAAGKGKRLNEVTQALNKCMIAYEGKPIIEHIVDRMSRLDKIKEIIIVVGYRAEDIINYIGNNYNGKKVTFVIQWHLKGLVDAMECAKKFIGGDDFLLLLGDEIMLNPRYEEYTNEFYAKNYYAFLGALPIKNREAIRKTYTFLHDDKNNVFRLIEKPKIPLNDLMGTGNVIFKNEAFEYIDQTPPHPRRGEKELPDLLQTIIDHGLKVGYFDICDDYNNVNTTDDLNRIQDNGEGGRH